jgi:hypothetical protein
MRDTLPKKLDMYLFQITQSKQFQKFLPVGYFLLAKHNQLWTSFRKFVGKAL